MKKDYRKELEGAARQMIRIHRVDTLIKLILRTIIKNLRVHHAGIFLYDKSRHEYVVKVSRGKRGLKIPAGFAKVKPTNPLIGYFTDARFAAFDREFLLCSRVRRYLASARARGERRVRQDMESIVDQLSLYRAEACVPGFFRNHLVGVLFLGKKEDGHDFTHDELGFLSILASDVVMAIQNASLIEDLNRQLDVNKRLFLSTVAALATVIEAKDKYTRGHTQRVVGYSLDIAEELRAHLHEQYERFKENLSISALLHDIGKISIPETVLNKKTLLTREERECVYNHPATGAEILNPIKEFEDIMVGVKYHHERYDGTGYPYKLKGNRIPLIAAIIAVADAYDAMTTDRPYRKALSREEATKEIRKCRGTQFSPRVVDAFLRSQRKTLQSLHR